MNIGLEQLCKIAKNSFEWSKLEIYWGGGGGREEKGEGSRGENPVLMKAMIFSLFPTCILKNRWLWIEPISGIQVYVLRNEIDKNGR